MSTTRGSGRAATVASVSLLSAALVLSAAVSAVAADLTVTSATLPSALTDGSADTLVAQGSIAVVGFTVSDDDTLDLHGEDVVVSGGVQLGAGVTFTITDSLGGGSFTAIGGMYEPGISTTDATLIIDSGHIVAEGGNSAAGIGSTIGSDAGTVIINGGNVEATGGVAGGAGIGGGRGNEALGTGSNAGTITITGGTVTASGRGAGAGIGGGYWPPTRAAITNGGTVTISGGTVTAAGSMEFPYVSAGIGGGGRASGGSISISGSAVVTASSPSSTFGGAVGPGSGNGATFGSLSVDGTSRLNVNSRVDVQAGVTITGTGTIGGTGVIHNYGIIQPVVDHSDGLSVDVFHFISSFELNYPGAVAGPIVHVYAPTFAAGARTFPPDPTRVGFTFASWNSSPGGGGATITEATPPANRTLYAIWTAVTPVVTGPATAVSGAAQTYTVDQAGDDTTADFTFTTDDPTDVVTGNQIVFQNAGPRIITATSHVDPAVTGTTSTNVAPGAPAEIALTPSATSVSQGGTVTFTATAEDAAGNPIGDVTSQIVLSSSVGTDVIAGNTVTFPQASPHTITATIGGASSAVVIQVDPLIPAGAGMANTGIEVATSATLAALLLGGGILVLGVNRRRARRVKG